MQAVKEKKDSQNKKVRLTEYTVISTCNNTEECFNDHIEATSPIVAGMMVLDMRCSSVIVVDVLPGHIKSLLSGPMYLKDDGSLYRGGK